MLTISSFIKALMLQLFFPGIILGEKTPPTLPLLDLQELALLWLVMSAELEEAALFRFLWGFDSL